MSMRITFPRHLEVAYFIVEPIALAWFASYHAVIACGVVLLSIILNAVSFGCVNKGNVLKSYVVFCVTGVALVVSAFAFSAITLSDGFQNISRHQLINAGISSGSLAMMIFYMRLGVVGIFVLSSAFAKQADS